MTDYMNVNNLTDLENVARQVLTHIDKLGEYSQAQVAIIGGMAMSKYMGKSRSTVDIDFIVDIANAPQDVKNKLLSMADTPFRQAAMMFTYRAPNGTEYPIDITPQEMSPYMPTSASTVEDALENALPYISAVDLIVFKMNCCSMRPSASKRRRDADDAERLLNKEAALSPLVLTSSQKSIVEPRIGDMVRHGTKPENWWRHKLGLA